MDKSYEKQLEDCKIKYENYLLETEKELEREKKLLEEAKKRNDIGEINNSKNYIKAKEDEQQSLRKIIQELRLPYFTDIEERKEIANSFSIKVDEAIPDNDPIFFHGNGNIGIVEDIIREGALLTQKDRGYIISFSSYMICVTPKNNIQESLRIAGSGTEYSKPYGALFVISPPEEEFKAFESTIKSSSGLCCIQSTNFREDPDKLVAIITTNENIDRLKKVAKENGIDENKITDHDSFIEMYKQKNTSVSRK